ncbi:HNH endonuclease signature motif containing protein [Microlunatus antarcticus]|uniref:HNH nuclease domain-containing protein n=1 Tax=Microlunatus antarcticus TaxID=53388 RepID=A0A7W5P5E5_9ACTN|nr:hypothetical protein [Microlunatus antarcticus]
MEFEGGESGAAVPVDDALDDFVGALDRLIGVVEAGGLDGFDGVGLVGFLQRFEQTRNRMSLVDHRAVRVAETVRLSETVGQPNLAATLAWVLRLSRGEASQRVRATEAVGERVAMTGEELGPLRPALAAAQRAGDVSPEQVDVCVRALEGVDRRGFDPADLDLGDRLLAEYAVTFGPKELRVIAQQVVDRIDPDGTVPAEQLNSERRHLAFRKLTDGMYAVEGRLTGELGAKLHAVLGPLAKPRLETVVLEDGRTVDGPDPRHHGQRTHDALVDVCDRLLRSGTLPDSGGTPATVIVIIPEDDLQARARWGVTSEGTMLSTETIVRLADQADVYPAVLTRTGVVLQLGRTRRLASNGQTVALIARDGGCSFPGCDRPPEWCERHHVTEWSQGGRTDLHNLTLLCAWHHHNFAARGWTCVMVDDLPAWIPPTWVDREQRPVLNARILARQRGLGLRC